MNFCDATSLLLISLVVFESIGAGPGLLTVLGRQGIGVTALKTSCRKLGIRRWPMPAAVPTARVDESQLEVAVESADASEVEVESADSSEVEVESADALLAEVTSGYLAVQPLQDQQAQASAIDRQLANSPGVFGKPDDQPRNPLQMIMMEVAEDFEQLRDTPWRFDVGAMIKDDASQSESAQSQQ